MSSSDVDILYKVVVIGDSGVGKSNLITRFTLNKFTTDNKPTIGVEFGAKNVQIDGKTIKGQIWDTAGQERFRAISAAYYRGANGALIVYDITKKETFGNATRWMKEIREQGEPDVVLMVCGNKLDLAQMRQVDTSDGKDFAAKNKVLFFETSAMDNSGVDQAFTTLLEEIYKKNKEGGKEKDQGNTTISLTTDGEGEKKGGGCAC